jgi:CO dehydrogenase/acetyl-CoA synthase epsilon subunit
VTISEVVNFDSSIDSVVVVGFIASRLLDVLCSLECFSYIVIIRISKGKDFISNNIHHYHLMSKRSIYSVL